MIISVLVTLIITSRNKVIYYTQNTTKNGDYFTTKLKLLNESKKPIPLVFISIYKKNSTEAIYSYPILKTDNNGEVTFITTEKEIDIIASTQHLLNYQGNEISFVAYFSIKPTPFSSSLKILRLVPITINLTNFNVQIPGLKVEAVVHSKNNLFYPDQELASNASNKSRFAFYASPANYSFNLDTIEFDSKNNYSLALSQPNVTVNLFPKTITFDQSKTIKYLVKISNTKYGWFKLIGDNTGDFQTQYFGEPVPVISNLSNLYLEMVYIPSPQCTQFYESKFPKDEQTQVILNCDDTNMRFDYVLKKLDPQEIFTIYPPSSFAIPTKNLEFLYRENIHLTNPQDQEIAYIYAHKIWDLRILPLINIDKNKQTARVSIAVDNWSNNQITTEFTHQNPIPLYFNNQPQPPPQPYTSWQSVYNDRYNLNSKSVNFLTTWPHYNKFQPTLSPKISNVASCSDLQNQKLNKTIVVNITPNNVYNSSEHQKFTTCLSQFAESHKNNTFILKNSFIDDTFDTIKHTVFYHFYLILHQGSDNHVGLIADKFYDLFYGFQDFSVVIPSNFMKITDNSKNFDLTLKDWLSQYNSITQSPIVYLNN